jgi:hypothetical protein
VNEHSKAVMDKPIRIPLCLFRHFHLQPPSPYYRLLFSVLYLFLFTVY